MKNKTVIYTLSCSPDLNDPTNPVATHKGPPLFENLTEPWIKTYAEAIGADYKKIGNEIVTDYPTFTKSYFDAAQGVYQGQPDPRFKNGRKMYPFWYKILVLDIFLKSEYEKMLFLDLDILIGRLDYDIFEDMGEAEVTAASTEHIGGLNNVGLESYYRELDPPNEKMIRRIREEKYHFNSGVFAITRSGAEKIIEDCLPYSTFDFLPYHQQLDQGFLSCKFWEHCSVKKLDPSIHIRAFDWNRKPRGVFLHFCSDGRYPNKCRNIEVFIYHEAKGQWSDQKENHRYAALPYLDGSHGYPVAPQFYEIGTGQ